ncbi:hypothetical protein E3N88_38311 [Mikania micrantha]|uniref:Late embryogenesis abundant protein LEA-2 subgroup domain-containing protein n=1 Tax=Mikania micrantha TaxID=192012 RepID=A0A5N6LTM9_9ASTR|nr:hypothetical protein E3N88_38311 [Mikania micrantha]
MLFTSKNDIAGIKYNDSNFTIMYRGVPVVWGVVPGFYQAAHSVKNVQTTVALTNPGIENRRTIANQIANDFRLGKVRTNTKIAASLAISVTMFWPIVHHQGLDPFDTLHNSFIGHANKSDFGQTDLFNPNT